MKRGDVVVFIARNAHNEHAKSAGVITRTNILNSENLVEVMSPSLGIFICDEELYLKPTLLRFGVKYIKRAIRIRQNDRTVYKKNRKTPFAKSAVFYDHTGFRDANQHAAICGLLNQHALHGHMNHSDYYSPLMDYYPFRSPTVPYHKYLTVGGAIGLVQIYPVDGHVPNSKPCHYGEHGEVLL